MANEWAPDGPVQDQIDDTVKDAVSAARARMPAGEGSDECVDCGEPISAARRKALPGVRTCVPCQGARDAKRTMTGINRRGEQGQPTSLTPRAADPGYRGRRA